MIAESLPGYGPRMPVFGLNVSGPLTKLNLTPRSDPPLQFSEIIALLATGRAPDGPYEVVINRGAADDGVELIGEFDQADLERRLRAIHGEVALLERILELATQLLELDSESTLAREIMAALHGGAATAAAIVARVYNVAPDRSIAAGVGINLVGLR